MMHTARFRQPRKARRRRPAYQYRWAPMYRMTGDVTSKAYQDLRLLYQLGEKCIMQGVICSIQRLRIQPDNPARYEALVKTHER